MNKPVQVKATHRADPHLRKLARALLLLAEQNEAKPQPKRSTQRKAS